LFSEGSFVNGFGLIKGLEHTIVNTISITGGMCETTGLKTVASLKTKEGRQVILMVLWKL
jgi:hypothetical protein